MANFSVTQYGKELDPKYYSWDKDGKTFYSDEPNLVLNFSLYNGVQFFTNHSCVFITGDSCIFNTEENCVFITGKDCSFENGDNCTFIRLMDICAITNW